MSPAYAKNTILVVVAWEIVVANFCPGRHFGKTGNRTEPNRTGFEGTEKGTGTEQNTKATPNRTGTDTEPEPKRNRTGTLPEPRPNQNRS